MEAGALLPTHLRGTSRAAHYAHHTRQRQQTMLSGEQKAFEYARLPSQQLSLRWRDTASVLVPPCPIDTRSYEICPIPDDTTARQFIERHITPESMFQQHHTSIDAAADGRICEGGTGQVGQGSSGDGSEAGLKADRPGRLGPNRSSDPVWVGNCLSSVPGSGLREGRSSAMTNDMSRSLIGSKRPFIAGMVTMSRLSGGLSARLGLG